MNKPFLSDQKGTTIIFTNWDLYPRVIWQTEILFICKIIGKYFYQVQFWFVKFRKNLQIYLAASWMLRACRIGLS